MATKTTTTTSSSNNQDWFLMTGDLIINLRSTKTGDTNNNNLFKLKNQKLLNNNEKKKKFFKNDDKNIDYDDDDDDTILDNNQNKIKKSSIANKNNEKQLLNDDCLIDDGIRSNLEKNLEYAKETNIVDNETTKIKNNEQQQQSINNLQNNNNNNTFTISSLSSSAKISKNSLLSLSSGNVSSGIVFDDDGGGQLSSEQQQQQKQQQESQQQQQLQQQQSIPKSPIKPPSSNCSSDYQHFSFFDNHNDHHHQQQQEQQSQDKQKQKQENSYENIGDLMFKSKESNLYNQISDDDDEEDGDENYCRSIDELSIESDNSSLLYYSTPLTKFNKQQQHQQQKKLSNNKTTTNNNNIDTQSASRLAKRLYNLDGFKKSDVSKHLSKNNEFSRKVAEEYLKLFNFRKQKLDVALRNFLSYFHLIGETQERERVLVYFSKRYYECNCINYDDDDDNNDDHDNDDDDDVNDIEKEFKSIDSIHTLTCALMLLNTDLHDQTIRRKMTCSNFIINLSGMNDGEDYSNSLLKYLYYSIKNNSLGWIYDDDGDENDNENHHNGIDHQQIKKNKKSNSRSTNVFTKITTISKSIGGSPYATLPRKFNQQQILSSSSSMMTTAASTAPGTPGFNTMMNNPFIELPNPLVAIEYKKGYIRRKCCYDSNGRKTSIGKRSWKLFYATLRDLVLYLHKDENGFRKSQLQESFINSIRIHHSIASKAEDYPKKKFVFRLITADYAEYLFETSDSKELQSWIETINTTAASLSAPTLPMAVSSDKKKFKKEIFPVSHTKLSLREQLKDQENKLLSLQKEMELLLEKSCQNSKYRKGFMEKETYLQHEIKRYRVYVSCLRKELKKLPITIIHQQQPIQQHSLNDLKQKQHNVDDNDDDDDEDDDNLCFNLQNHCNCNNPNQINCHRHNNNNNNYNHHHYQKHPQQQQQQQHLQIKYYPQDDQNFDYRTKNTNDDYDSD